MDGNLGKGIIFEMKIKISNKKSSLKNKIVLGEFHTCFNHITYLQVSPNVEKGQYLYLAGRNAN